MNSSSNYKRALSYKHFSFLLSFGLLIFSFAFTESVKPKGIENEVVADCCETTGKPYSIAFTYDDIGSCIISDPIGAPSATCSGIAGFLGEEVYIIVRNPNDTTEIFFNGTVSQGGTFLAVAPGPIAPSSKFSPNTEILIKESINGNVLQRLFFHTSCSEDLDEGSRFGAIIVRQLTSIKGNGTLECGTSTQPPTVPDCPLVAGRFEWNNNIVIDANGVVSSSDVFFDGVTAVYPIIYSIDKGSEIDIKSMVAWFGDPNAGLLDQTDQRFKLIFRNGNTTIMETNFTTDGIIVNSTIISDEWVGDPGIVGSNVLSDDVDNLQLIHFGGGGDVYPASVCFVATAGALPINLLSFDAELMENHQVDLHWATASETGNDYFELQRSTDGTSFYSIATVHGAGYSAEKLNYTYLDKTPLMGQNYYRLKQVDFDGQFTFSDIINVQIYAQHMDELQLSTFPNPVRNKLNYQLIRPLEVDTEIQVLDLLGRVVYEDLIPKGAVLINQEIDVSLLSQGIHFLKAKSGLYQKVKVFEVIK